MKIKGTLMSAPVRLATAAANRRLATARQRILIARHSAKPVHAYRDFLRWMETELPDLRAHCEFCVIPCNLPASNRFRLFASWAADTLCDYSPRAFRAALRLQRQIDDAGLPTLNRLDCVPNAGKSAAAERIATVGIRTPRMVPIRDFDQFRKNFGGLSLPLLIREDRGHGKPAIFVSHADQIQESLLHRFRSPVAVEYIDVRSSHDGAWRKYRYVAIGDKGLPRHLHINDQWEVRPHRRLDGDGPHEEELAFLNRPDPNHDAFQAARRALQLDVVGFDYSYDQAGRMVIWEANPQMNMNIPKQPHMRARLENTVFATFAALAELYYQRSGLTMPSKLKDLVHELVDPRTANTNAMSARTSVPDLKNSKSAA